MWLDRATDVLWLLRRQAREFHFKYLPGVEWLPPPWLKDNVVSSAPCVGSPAGVRAQPALGVWRATRIHPVAGRREAPADGTGDRRSCGPDPAHRRHCRCDRPGGPLSGSSRRCRAGGRSGLFPDLRIHVRTLGAAIHGVPWTDTGPDLAALEEMARTHRPRLFVTTPIVQNPTGYSISQGTAFRLLQLAERYDFYILEDDVDGTCHPNPPPRLASLDQLNPGHLRERLFQGVVTAAAGSDFWPLIGTSWRISST